MVSPDPGKSIPAALTALVMNCPELAQLEAHLARFNIFRVLGADRDELRHSNTLAWLFQPEESHGLGDRFLRKWLMKLLNDAEQNPPVPSGWASPVEVDVLDVEHVEVKREFENIDLLLTIHRTKGRPWIVCIENKIESVQHSDQLARYRAIVERRFGDAERRLYVFLTKHGESATQADFIESSYEEVVQVLDECLAERRATIGPEPLLLLQHYRQLLAEDFMDESESAKLARRIYLRHRTALDFIFEYKVDPIYEATNALDDALRRSASELNIIVERSDKGWVRFLPTAWDVPANRGGTAWGENSRYLLCEVGFWTKNAELHVTIGRAPESWADLVWGRAATTPFRQEWKKRPAHFIKPYKAKSDVAIDSLAGMDEDEISSRLLDWLRGELQKPRFQEAVEALVTLLSQLKRE